jgi:DNA-binding cell septation regulator SpoVG
MNMIVCPEGFTEEDFRNRISGNQLMKRWNLSLVEIQTFPLQAYRENRLRDKLLYDENTVFRGENLNRIMGKLIPLDTINIQPFRPTSTKEMQDCFYILEDVKKLEKDRPELIKTQLTKYETMGNDFPRHPCDKPKEEDPLFVAMVTRKALMNKDIKNPHNHGARNLLKDWIQTNYPKISGRQLENIISIVNDGRGRGKSKI